MRAAAPLLILAVACDAPAPPSTNASQAPSSASSVASARSRGAPSARASDADVDEPPPSPSQRRGLVRGRQLAQEGKWAEAKAAFQEATAEQPDSAIAFSELGWAAFNADDLELATTATARGLELTKDAKPRAAMLYNRGRIEEALGKKEDARRSYEESLSLRRNDVVKKRLESLGGKAPGPAPVARELVCQKTFSTVREACNCLLGERAALGLPAGEGTCVQVPVDTDLSARPLEVVHIAVGEESVDWILADVRGMLRPVAEVDGDVVAKKLLAPLDDDATVASVMFLRTSTETGKTVKTTFELVCLVGTRKDAPVCPLEITHAVAEIKDGKPNPDRTATLARTIKPNGSVIVKKQAGPEDLIPSGAVGTHKLF